ncbi:MAG: bifunctional histidinol-phosphatase/imidazoleglycerol-phosphate dehydratase HisB [Succinatimonas hippei]|nr:bifunctional histidinol-phosphatase/imidazoleglycerol-phosphate dehydratase HisB [Succinatimonas hippei]
MKKYLFIDRDGTLIKEPHDYQVDDLSKVVFEKNVIPALLKLKEAGYTFVMVSNQDGLGTESFPLETFTPAHELVLNTLSSQGIDFEQVLICPHKPEDKCSCRKPNIGMVLPYLADTSWDRENSYFIGDRDTDVQMGLNMGIKSLKLNAPKEKCVFCAKDNSNKPLTYDELKKLGESGSALTLDSFVVTTLNSNNLVNEDNCPALNDSMILDWDSIARMLCQRQRVATVERNTKETQIKVSVNLDKSGCSHFDTGMGFFDHMLDQIATHAGISLDVRVKGDLFVDEHHSIEDTGIALGEALVKALGDKRGIKRFGFVLPMDEVYAKIFSESLDDDRVTVALDISGRPYFKYDFEKALTKDSVGTMPTQMVSHFFGSLSTAMGLTLHMYVSDGNCHHQVEALFKAFGRALRIALSRSGNDLPSSKGKL